MSGRNRRSGYHRHKNDKHKVGGESREVLENIDENNPVMKMFKEYAAELDDKHDRYERIVKLSRDITIESKRIIFLLHTTATDIEHKREQILNEANLRLNVLVENNFKAVAKELHGFDSYQYLRAYTGGLQEFTEAVIFYQYLKSGKLDSWENANKKFTFEESNENSLPESNKTIALLYPMPEFFLGLTDFTGELMRRCINNLASGNIDDCFRICTLVKNVYSGFLSINNSGYKEMNRKVYVLKQSLGKIELVCYNIQVRGSEIPKHMLANVFNSTNEMSNEDDEGYY